MDHVGSVVLLHERSVATFVSDVELLISAGEIKLLFGHIGGENAICAQLLTEFMDQWHSDLPLAPGHDDPALGPLLFNVGFSRVELTFGSERLAHVLHLRSDWL